jgi:hypothetical protein
VNVEPFATAAKSDGTMWAVGHSDFDVFLRPTSVGHTAAVRRHYQAVEPVCGAVFPNPLPAEVQA